MASSITVHNSICMTANKTLPAWLFPTPVEGTQCDSVIAPTQAWAYCHVSFVYSISHGIDPSLACNVYTQDDYGMHGQPVMTCMCT